MAATWLLVSDLDGTLLGDDDALGRFRDWHRSRADRVQLVYATGRFLDSVEEMVNRGVLPEPRAVIGGVGTEIHDFDSRTPFSGWPTVVHGSWNAELVRDCLANFAGLEIQPLERQSPVKASFYADDMPAERLGAIEDRLRQAGLQFDLVYSVGRYLDVLPLGVNKGSAVRWLADHWEMSGTSIVVAGDTGNDLAMMEVGYRAIVVGNATPELRTFRGSHVFHASSHFAEGVLEGLRHWMREE